MITVPTEAEIREWLDGAALVVVETFDGAGQSIVRYELRGGGIERILQVAGHVGLLGASEGGHQPDWRRRDD